MRCWWPHDQNVEVLCPLASLIWLVPLVPAALAWRRHLIGGISIVVAVAGFLLYFILKPPVEALPLYFVAFPPALVFPGGGILNIRA